MKKYSLLFSMLLFVVFSYAQEKSKDCKTCPNNNSVKTIQKENVIPANQLVKAPSLKTDEERISYGLPESFPKFINTGNPKLDNKNFSIAKKEWFALHPEHYQAYLNKLK